MPKVLLVDDDANWLRVCSKRLPKTDYTLMISDSIESALRLLSAETFAVVVADIRMPGASGGLGGFEVLERTRALGLDTRVVMTTAYVGGLQKRVDEALGKGAHNFVEKKAGFQELDKCIVDAIDYWQWWREEREPFVEELEPTEPPIVEELEPTEPPIWTTEMQRKSWEHQLAQHSRNLAMLEEQAAKFGLIVPVEILNAIEEKKQLVLELESKLRGLEGGGSQ